MIATIPRPHALYISPLPMRHDAQIHRRPPSPTSIDVAIRSHLREKGRMTKAQIIDCIGDRTSTGETSSTSHASEALERLVDIGAIELSKGRYSTMFGPNRDYNPEAHERAVEAATSARCAEMRTRENRRKLLKMEGK